MSIKYRFILGVGRSGTTFLGKIVNLTKSPSKTIIEPFPGVKNICNRKGIVVGFCNPIERCHVELFSNSLREMPYNNDIFDPVYAKYHIERDDYNKAFLIIKEVHSLISFPEFSKAFNGKSVVITRDVERVIDSYFFVQTNSKRLYLLEEFNFVKDYLSGRFNSKLPLLDEALKTVSTDISRYFTKPRIITKELMRQVAITKLMMQYLILWSNSDNNVMHITHRDLSLDPVKNAIRIFNFLELDFDDDALEKIKIMTTGNKDGFYDTEKNSKNILMQRYKYLDEKDIKKIRRFIGEGK